MFYYAYLNELDVVQAIYGLPSQITDPRYILVPTNDQTLIGKKYNRATGQFEDAVFYYAVLNNKDIVVEVISSLTPITDSSKILIASNDTKLIGKWYNRQTAQFLDPPIHVLADHSTQQINLVNQDKWLQTELDEIKSKLADLGRSGPGDYKCVFDIIDHQETTSEWANGKNYVFNFNTGVPGYFPKMIRLVNEDSDVDNLIADFFIVKNPDGSVKYAYLNKTYLGIPESSTNTTPTLTILQDLAMSSSAAMRVGRYSDGNKYDTGGSAFFQSINVNGTDVSIGRFSYTENTFSFRMQITDNIIGHFTRMDLKAYVF